MEKCFGDLNMDCLSIVDVSKPDPRKSLDSFLEHISSYVKVCTRLFQVL